MSYEICTQSQLLPIEFPYGLLTPVKNCFYTMEIWNSQLLVQWLFQDSVQLVCIPTNMLSECSKVSYKVAASDLATTISAQIMLLSSIISHSARSLLYNYISQLSFFSPHCTHEQCSHGGNPYLCLSFLPTLSSLYISI